MRDALHIAVLGDVHGHLTLAYRLLARWQREAGATLDAILQAGDLGAYPPPFRLDKATRRFAERDPDELGFAHYFEPSPEADEVLGDAPDPRRRIDADLYFVKGNHDDFEFLAEAARDGGGDRAVPVDAYARIHYLPSGARLRLARGPHALTVGALGGISDDGAAGRDPVSMHYTSAEARALRTRGGSVDVLLTHEPALGSAAGLHPKYETAGSRDVLDLLRALAPRYHFCGHYHEPGQRLAAPEGTESYQLNAVNFARPRRLNPGCAGILRWAGPDASSFELLAAPWLAEFTEYGYRSL